MNTQHEHVGADAVDLRQDLLHQALFESPEYVEHIAGLFGSCAEHLRSGEDQSAMLDLARAADDLNQFRLLVDLFVDATASEALPDTQSFRQDIDGCIREMQDALVQEDLVAVSDQIDVNLLPIFPRWPAVAAELSAGMLA